MGLSKAEVVRSAEHWLKKHHASQVPGSGLAEALEVYHNEHARIRSLKADLETATDNRRVAVKQIAVLLKSLKKRKGKKTSAPPASQTLPLAANESDPGA